MSTMARRCTAAAGVLALLFITAVSACSDADGAQRALKAFAGAWAAGKLGEARLLDSGGTPLDGATAQTRLSETEGDLAARRPTIKVRRAPTVKGTDATAAVSVEWPVSEGVIWTYESTVRLARRADAWLPVFTPQTIHPDLPDTGARLTLKQTAAGRAGIFDGAGQPIVTDRPVVIVGIERQRVTDEAALLGGLKSIFTELGIDIDLTSLPERIRSASPQAFIELATLRRKDYDRVRRALQGLPGTVFSESVLPLAPSRVFARALLGQVGDATKEIIDKNPGKFRPGDKVGRSGLQQRYDDRLRGTPGVNVVAGEKSLFTSPPRPGPPVRTTLDARLQNAADAALTGEPRRAAIVAVRVSDSAVVAVANGPDGGQVNLAFTAAVPPGSTFKTVSAMALLDNGSVTPDSPVDCPATVTVDGFGVRNAHSLALGSVPFRTAFAQSCNTAFAALAPRLGPSGLTAAGTALGAGVAWNLGLDVFSGKVSAGGSAVEQAAAAFGQGTTQVSPVVLAGAAAAVARGQWKQPVLLTDPAPAAPAPDGPPLKSAAALRALMREVVTSGTASALNGLAGEPVYGKTGTAEFDNNPAHTHSWFMGWQGDIAIAVFVENGGDSTGSAVPAAGKFFGSIGA
jgi:cell division protein FtsI/penicillin-binding protein 2